MADDTKDGTKSEAKKPDDTVAQARERFDLAKDAYGSNRTLAIEDTKFVLGDSDNGYQWPADIFRQRSMVEKRPCLTVNVTAQHCNQIINNIRQNRPQCKVLPGDAKAAKKAAEIYAGLLRSIQAASQADVAHDTAAEHAIYGGEGYWVISTDYESPTSFNQTICILPVENPQLVYVDPFCGMNKLKAQWGFLFEEISKEEAKRLYGKDGVDPSSWASDNAQGWYSDKTVRVAKYYYCEHVEDTLYLLHDGTTALKSELQEQGDDAVKQAESMAALIEEHSGGKAKRATTRVQWKFCKLVGGHDKPLEPKDWPGAYLPIVQVVGKEVNVNGEIVRKGVVRDLKDPARMVNYSYSGAVETVALQNKIPYIASAEAIEGYEDEWAVANQSTASYLPYNQFADNGEKIDRPQRQEPAVMPAAQVQMLQLSTEQMRAASGQQNSNFGIKSEAASGVGIQRLKVQGETATFHFPDNLARALHDEAVIIIDLIPKVMDTFRVVQLLGVDGKEDRAHLDPDMDSAYSLYSDVTEDDIKHAFNPTVGKYDVVIDTGPSYQTQRQEGADRMMELAGRNPALMQIAGDIVMQAMDFPFADKLAERLKKTLPPNLQDGNGQPQIPPQVQAQLQHAEQLIQQLHGALQECQGELAQLKAGEMQKFNEVLVKAYSAETDRITALGGAMTPELVMQLVQQTVQQVAAMPSPLQPPGQMPPMPDPGPAMPQQPQQAPQGAFSLPEQGSITPPAMAATGANPGLGIQPQG